LVCGSIIYIQTCDQRHYFRRFIIVIQSI
jgi:hypothetical protein